MSLRAVTRTLRVVPASTRVSTSALASSSRVLVGSPILQQRTSLASTRSSASLLFKPPHSIGVASLRLLHTSTIRHNAAQKDKPSESETDSDAPPPKASLRERLKFLTRRYGWWALGVYLAASTVDLSLTFLAIHLLGADHIRSLEASLRKSIGLEQRDPDSSDSSNTSGGLWTEAVLAYTIHKTLLLPVRVAFTAAVTPSFVKWLVKMGWAKANHQVKAQVGRKAADKAIADVVRRNAAKETVKHH